ncbi:MAG: hypothetical protein A2Y10_19850 [Planctomycetes bacterium GWF2_41_51]|nr:MAG: hypothetical protein A2Y10_19850 [Planctomycetes bacterium GWF2_41_51]
MLSNAQTRSISAENPTGQPGNGAKAAPDEKSPSSWLGQGWKVSPCVDLKSRQTFNMAKIEGPAIIQHIWITARKEFYRDIVIRFYWDNEEDPSVEVPLGDFFAIAHGVRYPVNSIPVAVNPDGGFNTYWPMPFRTSCKITVENQSDRDMRGFFYQVTYSVQQVSDDAAYFHSQWRRTRTTDYVKPEHIIVDNIKGKGQYVGTFLAWVQMSDEWWGEGEVKFYLDGDSNFPTICGTGTEDYFGGAWCFGDSYLNGVLSGGQNYSTAFLGYPYRDNRPGLTPKHSLYRWHLLDPIRFNKELKVTIQALGWYRTGGKFEPLTDDISSTAYWYQTEPHTKFPPMMSRKDRIPR